MTQVIAVPATTWIELLVPSFGLAKSGLLGAFGE